MNEVVSASWKRGVQVPVLDHGYIKLIDHMGSDEAIVDAARMSTGKGFISWDPYPGREDGDEGFLEFLLKNNHTSPFEMGELVIEVQAPIFVYREWHRHRTQSYNELSARYTQMPNLHYLPTLSRMKKQSKTNKQSTSEEKLANDDIVMDIFTTMKEQQDEVYGTYDKWVEMGLAKEVARVNTPVSRYSRMRAKANLLNWLKFLNLRMRPNAQLEIRCYANVVANIISQIWPRTYRLFEEYMLHAVSFSRTEMEVLKEMVKDAEFPAGTKSKKRLTDKQIKAFMEKLT